jgi:hypothetical protein
MDADDRRAESAGEIENGAYRVGVGFTERSTEHARVLLETEDPATVDPSLTANHSVAVGTVRDALRSHMRPDWNEAIDVEQSL